MKDKGVILIKNGTVVDPSQGLEAVRDLIIEKGKIQLVKIGRAHV